MPMSGMYRANGSKGPAHGSNDHQIPVRGAPACICPASFPSEISYIFVVCLFAITKASKCNVVHNHSTSGVSLFMPTDPPSNSPMPNVLRPASPNNPSGHQKSTRGPILGQGATSASSPPFTMPTGVVIAATKPAASKAAPFQIPKLCPQCKTNHTGACTLKKSTPTPSIARKSVPAQEVFDKYKTGYDATDRVLPFTIMKDVTNDSLVFSDKKANQKQMDKASNKKFTLRHYTTSVDGPPRFNAIEPNFELVNKGVKTLHRTQASNTNEDDWNRLGNTAFTFFLLAIDGKVSGRKFLAQATHYAEIDVEDSAQLSALGLDTAEFFASADLLHEKGLSKTKVVKGPLTEFKSLMLASSGVQAIQLGLMGPEVLLRSIDEQFLGSLEVKIPGSVAVGRWVAV